MSMSSFLGCKFEVDLSKDEIVHQLFGLDCQIHGEIVYQLFGLDYQIRQQFGLDRQRIENMDLNHQPEGVGPNLNLEPEIVGPNLNLEQLSEGPNLNLELKSLGPNLNRMCHLGLIVLNIK